MVWSQLEVLAVGFESQSLGLPVLAGLALRVCGLPTGFGTWGLGLPGLA